MLIAVIVVLFIVLHWLHVRKMRILIRGLQEFIDGSCEIMERHDAQLEAMAVQICPVCERVAGGCNGRCES